MASTPAPPPPSGFHDSDLLNLAVRMVIPMRREFGCALDVPHFLHDFTYAQSMLDKAKASQDARLRDNAAYLESKMFGPRNSAGAAPMARTDLAAEQVNPSPPPAPPGNNNEAELRAAMAKKYQRGLR